MSILPWLSRKDIQCPDRLGHDAIEDARTTLELARYFLKYGPKKVSIFAFLKIMGLEQRVTDQSPAVTFLYKNGSVIQAEHVFEIKTCTTSIM